MPAELRRISEVLQAAVAEARADQFQDKVTALGGGGIARLYLLAAAMAYPTTLEPEDSKNRLYIKLNNVKL